MTQSKPENMSLFCFLLVIEEEDPASVLLTQRNLAFCRDEFLRIRLSDNPCLKLFSFDFEKIKHHFLSTFGTELIATQFHPQNAHKWPGWQIDGLSMFFHNSIFHTGK